MSVVKVNSGNFAEEVLGSDRTVLVDFNADWCGPCRMLAPMLEKVAAAHPEAKFAAVNIDDEPELAVRYGISSIPCLIAFRGGSEIRRSVGLIPPDAIAALIKG
jgi:thioredoxin 1